MSLHHLKAIKQLNRYLCPYYYKTIYSQKYSLFTTEPVMGDATNTSEPVVQYILCRTDLKTNLKWSFGSIMAQACHASVAAIHTYYSHEYTQEYLKSLQSMHKIVLQVPDEECLKKLNEDLKNNNVDFYLWLEQPDNIHTCIALRPYPKSQVEDHFKHLKLYRN